MRRLPRPGHLRSRPTLRRGLGALWLTLFTLLVVTPLAACAPRFRAGTWALPPGSGTAPIVRLYPQNHGALFLHGLELLPSGDRLLLGDGGSMIDLGRGPERLALHHALMFTPEGNLRAAQGLPCDWRQQQVTVRETLLGRGNGGRFIGCAEDPSETERATLESEGGRGLALRLFPVEEEGFGPERARLIVPGLSSADSLLSGPLGGLIVAGLEGAPRARTTTLVTLKADGTVVGRARVGKLEEAESQIERLRDGDLLLTETSNRVVSPRAAIRVARLSGVDLSLRWERELTGIGARALTSSPAHLGISVGSGLVYVGTTLWQKGVIGSHPAIFALSLTDGSVRWQQVFEGKGGNSLAAITAAPDGGLVVAAILQPGDKESAHLTIAGRRFGNDDAYDADLVLAWLSPEGRLIRARHWEAESERSTASVFVHLAHQPDGALVVAGNFFRRMFLLDRGVDGPSFRKPECDENDRCPVDRPNWHGPFTEPCCKDRVTAPASAYIVTIPKP